MLENNEHIKFIKSMLLWRVILIYQKECNCERNESGQEGTPPYFLKWGGKAMSSTFLFGKNLEKADCFAWKQQFINN